MITWAILLAVPIAILCERLLDPDGRRRIRAWMRRRRINRLPPTPEPLTSQMRKHWERVLTQSLAGHEVETNAQRYQFAAKHWETVTRARSALRQDRGPS